MFCGRRSRALLFRLVLFSFVCLDLGPTPTCWPGRRSLRQLLEKIIVSTPPGSLLLVGRKSTRVEAGALLSPASVRLSLLAWGDLG